MIPQLNILTGPATETVAPWANDNDPASRKRPSLRLPLILLALCAILIVAVSQSGRLEQAIDTLFAGSGDVPLSAKAKQAKAIAKLIQNTEANSIVPEAEGDDAVARNKLLPLSTLPVESARPFMLPTISMAQANNAQLCLTQAIYYEAANEPDTGKAAVAQVILNRMRHPAYPNTVCGVVYQGSSRPGCQFSFTCDGSMRRVPVPALWRKAAAIARAALSGHVEISVGMATHYHANYVLPRWAPKLTKIEQIGVHIFYRWPGSWGRPGAFGDAYAGAEWIPAFSQLYQGAAPAVELVEGELAPLAVLPRDPTDHRADNDVGGRVDTTKGWTPNIPDPVQSKSRFDALTSQQATTPAAAPATGS